PGVQPSGPLTPDAVTATGWREQAEPSRSSHIDTRSEGGTMPYRRSMLVSVAVFWAMTAVPARADAGLRVLRVACDFTGDKLAIEPFALAAGQFSRDGADLSALPSGSPLVLGNSIYYRIDNAGPIADSCKTAVRDVDVRFADDKIMLTETVKAVK